MKIAIILLGIVFCRTEIIAQGQTTFEKEIVSQFPLLKLTEIDSVQKIRPNDTIYKKVYNRYLKNKIDKKPIYIRNGKRELEADYFGLLPEGKTPVAQFGKDGQPIADVIFRSRAYPIGKVDLHPGYYSLIVKVFALLDTYYDIHNFTKDGKLMSVVPLYYFENKKGMEEKIGVLHVKSCIAKDGKIYWWERYPNRTRERVYFLNKDGFFEILSEKIEGEIEN